jgi:hypothetical protein
MISIGSVIIICFMLSYVCSSNKGNIIGISGEIQSSSTASTFVSGFNSYFGFGFDFWF